VSLDSIETQNVINHFPELIVAWCQNNCGCKKCKNDETCNCKRCSKMCIKAIEKFSDSFSPDFIRKNIPSNFKVKYRQQNAKVGILKRLGLFENSIKENLYQTSVYQSKKK
jgi:hypothetical protein